MTIFGTVKETMNTAVDTISSVAQSIVEKNRVNAKLNRLRLIMKNESELMNRAYIALGKQFYEMQKDKTDKYYQGIDMSFVYFCCPAPCGQIGRASCRERV